MYRAHRRRPGSSERKTPSIWDSSEAWAACAKALREYDEDMIQDWKEEVDTLLVFAGLFSAVVTAFNIESYQLLQQQPQDAATAILAHISSQLNSFTVNQNFINSTQPAIGAAGAGAGTSAFKPTAFAVRLNTMWFSSLVCSLLSASLGLLVKQWLREYLAGSSNISRESIRIRQYRYEGLRRWYVPEIILCLPILLQTALLLFFIGLIDMLWTLHPVVAAVVTTIIVLSLAFSAMTSLLPPLYPDCPYKSPQSWVICMSVQSIKRSLAALAARYYANLYIPSYPPPAPGAHSLAHVMNGVATPDLFASRPSLPSSLSLRARLSDALRGALHRLSLARAYASWKEREKGETEKGRRAAALDDATLAGADAMFMDDAFLDAVVRPCMRDIAPRAALRCVDRILLRRAPRVLNDMPYWDLARSLGEDGRGDTGTLTLMHLLLDVLHRLNAGRRNEGELDGEEEEDDVGDEKDDARRRVLMTMHRLVRAILGPEKTGVEASSDISQAHTKLFRRMFEVLAGVLDAEVGRASPERFVRERSFNLMLKLFPRFQDVGPSCIMAFCAYSNQTRIENAPYRFVQACHMVIRASAVLARDRSGPASMVNPSRSNTLSQPEIASPTPYVLDHEQNHHSDKISSFLSEITLCAEPLETPLAETTEIGDPASQEAGPETVADDYTSVRPAVLRVLDDLEGFLAAPVARAAEFRPTTSVLAECVQAVLALAARDPQAVSPGLVAALGDIIEDVLSASSSGAHGTAVGMGRDRYDSYRGRAEDQEGQVARQAMRVLRRMYGLQMRPGDVWRYHGADHDCLGVGG